jgi:peptidoglycan hydrolase-like protein with peptidoglycan-binding domain
MNFERPANAAAQKSKRAAMGQVYYDKYAKGVENTTMATNTYKKGQKTKLSENFSSVEFDCHGSGCCSETIINPKLVEYVQKIRDHFGKSITVTSGYRCPVHNKRIGGATGSRHSKGDAADIVVSGVAPREVAKYAESIGIKGIGLYETNADGHFTHVDTRDVKSFWYGQNEAKRTTFGGSTPAPDPSPVPAPKPSVNNNVLSIGDTGEDVRKLQEQLVKLGYNVGSKGPDGDFGSKTYAAVIDFQRKCNLKDDGIVGPLTEKAIKEAIDKMDKDDKIVIEEENIETFDIGDLVKLLPGSTFSDGKAIPQWVINSKIYIRSAVNPRNDTVAFSISKTGAITGTTKISNLTKYVEDEIVSTNFEPYIVQITADVLNVRAGASIKHKITAQTKKFDLHTIIAEANGWGKLKNGTGWISLEYTERFL